MSGAVCSVGSVINECLHPESSPLFSPRTDPDSGVPPELAYRSHHPDPHPRFVLDDEFIAYPTSVFGGLDLALVRVADLAP